MKRTTRKIAPKRPSKILRRRGTRAHGPADLKVRLEQALRAQFPHDTVDITRGYKDNVHVLVVSRRFDSLGEYERQGVLRAVIDAAGISRAERARISLLIALSPSELK